ncbi:MAG: cytochrome C oxidase Cbb3 [Bacteroidota bacterium]
MYKYILEQAGNINWMAVFALSTFVFVFLTSILLVLRKDKEHINKMSHLPLDEHSLTSETSTAHEN